jgi:hypothetical protein
VCGGAAHSHRRLSARLPLWHTAAVWLDLLFAHARRPQLCTHANRCCRPRRCCPGRTPSPLAGHLFGHKCIEQALRSRKQCPTCNAPARKRHVRLLFAPASQVVLDTSERDRVLQQLEEERRRHQQVSRRRAWRRARGALCWWLQSALLRDVMPMECDCVYLMLHARTATTLKRHRRSGPASSCKCATRWC